MQEIINDPRRAVPQQKKFTYLLTGRLRCAACGSSMVGRSVRVGDYQARYCVCTHAFNPMTKERCGARHVRLDRLEPAIWDEVGRVLADAERAAQAVGRAQRPSERRRLEREIANLSEREKRLVRLYSFGEIDEAFIREEGALLKKQRAALEERLRAMKQPAQVPMDELDPAALSAACTAVRAWLAHASDDDRRQVLEALQIAIVASRERAELSGVPPATDPQTLFIDLRASACTFVYAQDAPAQGLPFRLALNLQPVRTPQRRVAELAMA